MENFIISEEELKGITHSMTEKFEQIMLDEERIPTEMKAVIACAWLFDGLLARAYPRDMAVKLILDALSVCMTHAMIEQELDDEEEGEQE